MSIPNLDPHAPDFTRRYTNLADPRLGALAIAASDAFFAPMERMLSPEPAVFIPGKYDNHGKWMDGWESRRKRGPGNDWCIVKLARPARIFGVDIDTSHFTGNYPPGASLEACHCNSSEPGSDVRWTSLLPTVSLSGNSHHYHAISNTEAWTHVRVSIYPDGGIARLRIYGRPSGDATLAGAELDLAAAINGAYVVATNNEHFGLASTLLLPGRGVNMGDGWETRRRREPGNDWAIIALAAPGIIERVEVDTAHFKGNYPDACSLQAACLPNEMAGGTEQSSNQPPGRLKADLAPSGGAMAYESHGGGSPIVTQSMFWPELLAPHKLSMDAIHSFEPVAQLGPVSHVRFNIFPDGGVSRLRLFGKVADA